MERLCHRPRLWLRCESPGIQLSVQAITVLVKNEIHASIGIERLFVENAVVLLMIAVCHADRHVLGPAEIDHLVLHFC